jgi:hypothetical protein
MENFRKVLSSVRKYRSTIDFSKLGFHMRLLSMVMDSGVSLSKTEISAIFSIHLVLTAVPHARRERLVTYTSHGVSLKRRKAQFH